MTRVFNFSAGPAVMPLPVLEEAREHLLELPDGGMSVMEMSHRSKGFEAILASAENGVRDLLGLPEEYHILFLQGGASLQFSMAPMNLLSTQNSADYILTDQWSQKALKEACKVGKRACAGSTESEKFNRIPRQDELDLNRTRHTSTVTTNNTLYGTQWKQMPETNGVPIVADASSDILSRPMDVENMALSTPARRKTSARRV
jgi:phosphoserine aminotransferase